MDELRNDFEENCIIEGILNKSKVGKRLIHYGSILIIIVSLLLYFLIFNAGCYLCGYNFTYNILKFTDKNLMFASSMYFILLGNIFISTMIILYVQNCIVMSVLTKYYNDKIKIFKRLHKLNIIHYNFLTLPWDLSNDYYKCIKFVLNENQLQFKNKHLRKKNSELNRILIDELIIFNNQEIQKLEQSININSNKMFYAFFGGLVLNHTVNLIFKIIDFNIVNIANEIAIIIFLLFILFALSISIIKFYNSVSIGLIHAQDSRKCKTVRSFNEYLIDQKIKHLKLDK